MFKYYWLLWQKMKKCRVCKSACISDCVPTDICPKCAKKPQYVLTAEWQETTLKKYGIKRNKND